MFRQISKENAFDEILNQIIENIRAGRLKKGDALPAERAMAEAMGVSRPVIREVLRSLSLLGIIKTVHGGANYISEDLENCMIGPLSILLQLNNSSVQQNQQLRSALEIQCAKLAARNCSPIDAAELKLILAKLEVEQDEQIRGDLDRDLHIKIGKMANNPMLFNVMSAASQLTENIITGIRAYIMQKQMSVTEIDEQHKRLVDAIIAHDEESAVRYMQEHMINIEKYIEERAERMQENQ
ncbi:FadR family transcriptional regulator [Firmicutes bacterium OM04-13BH]|nr:FadR family transcriptional regulator [Firmicutes bacterium OM04-13BH]